MNKVQERLYEFIASVGINVADFERSAGLANGFVNSTNEKMRRSSKILISSAFPELNVEWVLRGTGKMLYPKGDVINSGDNSVNAINGNAISITHTKKEEAKKGVPYFDLGIIKDFEKLKNASKQDTDETINCSQYDDTDFWCKMDDKMMTSPLSFGDSIGVIKRNDWKRTIIYNRVYIIICKEIRMVRKISKSDAGMKFIKISSSNNSKDSQDFPVSEIKELYEVKYYIKGL